MRVTADDYRRIELKQHGLAHRDGFEDVAKSLDLLSRERETAKVGPWISRLQLADDLVDVDDLLLFLIHLSSIY